VVREEAAAQRLSGPAASVWAKSSRNDLSWLPLWRHLDDSAAVAGRLWDLWLPAATRQLIAAALPDGDADGRRLAVWLAGVHDIGKATPAFAVQVHSLAGRMRDQGLAVPYRMPAQDRSMARHAAAGQLLLERWLAHVHGWSRRQARPFTIVVGGHHGVPPAGVELDQADDRPHLLGLGEDQGPWQSVQRELLDRAATRWGAADRLPHWGGVALPQPAQVLLTGLVIVADWIASNEDLFSYDSERLHAPSRLADAWDELDLPTPWHAVPARGTPAELFAGRFTLPPGATPRPVQVAAVEVARSMPAAGLLVIEAPMGEGKTEAALAAVEHLAARCGAGGCFVALPTRATSDAMFTRVRDWLARVPDADRDAGALALTLAHGKARFNEDFVALMRRGYSSQIEVDVSAGRKDAPDRRRDLAAHRWLTGRKKAMLSSFVVGTIDQLLFGALKSRHLALRHLALAGKVVIIDEAHAYDIYMGQYLDRALEWLAAYRVPTIVLSATLPARRRKEMIQAYDRGRGVAPAPLRRPSWRDRTATAPLPDPYAVLDGDIGYPVLTASGVDGTPVLKLARPSGRETSVTLTRVADDLDTLASLLRADLVDGCCALVVRNTVRRVQETAAHLRAALAGSGTEISVAHSRFLAPDRADKDRWLRNTFGPPELLAVVGGTRPSRHVVVASQVAEQSLDIDFDLLVTDLAPVDLVLQRAGRLHRHPRGVDQSGRPERLRRARCVITGVDWSTSPPEPVVGSVLVYGRYPLLRSLAVLDPYLDGDRMLRLPADIAPLVQDAYGEVAVGPAAWQDAITTARAEHHAMQQKKERRAQTFRLGATGPAGEPILGWLEGGVGDVDDDPRLEGRRQVRDTAAESIEVLVLVRRVDGALITPPWLRRGGGREVPTEHQPPGDLARVVATCTLGLPIQLCRIETIEELEQRSYFPAWQGSPWLGGELVLVLEERGEVELDGHHLRYDPQDGLVVTRLDSRAAP
jgi:CRISPR-associated endonuclease/helicase Cas3